MITQAALMHLTPGGQGRAVRNQEGLGFFLPRSTLPDGKGGNKSVGPPLKVLKQNKNIKTTEAMADGPQEAAIGEVHRPEWESQAQMRGDGEQEDRGCSHDVLQNLGASRQIQLSRDQSLAQVFAENLTNKVRTLSSRQGLSVGR